MIEPNTFALEEYKVAQTRINQYRDNVARLEILTISGAVIVVGVLLGIGQESSGKPIPIFAWWAVVFLVLVAAVRCWALYFYITHLRRYVMQIEQHMSTAGYRLDGIETFSEKKWLRRFFIIMAIFWGP